MRNLLESAVEKSDFSLAEFRLLAELVEEGSVSGRMRTELWVVHHRRRRHDLFTAAQTRRF
jgi:hypothetical protein